MTLSKYISFRRRPVATTAESFCGADGVTINGGVHTVVGGLKMAITGDADMDDVQRAREAALKDVSTTRKASLLPGAKNVIINGGDTECLGGGSITITGRPKNPHAAGSSTVQYEKTSSNIFQQLYFISSNDLDGTAAAHVDNSGNSRGSAPKFGNSTGPPKITATIGRNARNVTIGSKAVLSANAGGRVVGRNIDDVLKALDKIGDLEQKGGERDAEVLPDAVGGEIGGLVRAIGGYEVLLDQELDKECC